MDAEGILASFSGLRYLFNAECQSIGSYGIKQNSTVILGNL